MTIKPKYLFFIIPLFIFVLTVSSRALAQDTPVIKSSGTLVASVNIQGVSIVSQEDNKFNLSFNLTNGKGVQSGIHYRVRLVTATEKGDIVRDEKIYDDSVFLPENSSIKKDISYTAPSTLSGTYQLYIDAQNEKGFLFAIASFGDVTLTSDTTGVVINAEKCSVKIGAQELSVAPFQGFLANKSESLMVTCEVMNASADTVSVEPSFETYTKTTVGEQVEGLEGDNTPVVFAPGESKTITFKSVTPSKPQLYKTIFSLNTNGTHSNSVEIGYAVRGTMGTIENFSLDKEVFTKGETAILSVIWSAYTDNINKQSTDVTLTATIKNAHGRACAEPMSQTVPMERTTPTTDFSFSITKDCQSPVVSVSLIDNEGIVLDAQTVQFESQEVVAAATMKRNAIIVVITLLMIIAVGFYIKRLKKHSDTTPQEPVV